MRLSITNAIRDILELRFKILLAEPELAEVAYKESPDKGYTWKSFNMIEYSTRWAQFVKLVDSKIKEQLGDELGAFTRKHSLPFLAQVNEIANSITAAESVAYGDRFKTMFD
ncbi:MAG TPA: hypothetical protein DGG95_03185 [Cytophagales bacterium]|jgi:hypothetical protein|nr:hypothetical protein [Cytophagales bacterium]